MRGTALPDRKRWNLFTSGAHSAWHASCVSWIPKGGRAMVAIYGPMIAMSPLPPISMGVAAGDLTSAVLACLSALAGLAVMLIARRAPRVRSALPSNGMAAARAARLAV